MHTNLKPDSVIFNETTKRTILVELTIPFGTNIEKHVQEKEMEFYTRIQ